MGGVKTGVFLATVSPTRLLDHNAALRNVQMESQNYKRLAAFHAQYLEKHSSPLRARFVYEFGADVAAAMPGVGRAEPRRFFVGSPTSSPLPAKYAGQTFDTTNQYQYRPYGDEVYSGPFSPEVKHRVMKAPEHEHTEAMFKEWAVHGKPKK